MKASFRLIVTVILIAEASLLLRRHKPRIIAVSGSVGKTTTKDAIFAAIKNNVYARKSDKSFNSEIGVPLTVLGLPNAWNNPFFWFRNLVEGFFLACFSRSYPEVLILETGIDRPGDMEKLAHWLKPDIVVLTRLPEVPVHVEYFPSPTAVIDEKMKIVQALQPDGVFIYNSDDILIEGRLPEILQRKIGFGRYRETDFTIRTDSTVYEDDQPAGTRCTLQHFGNSYDISVEGVVGTQLAYACGAAVAVADELSVPIDAAVASLKELHTASGRMRLIKGVKSTLIIDDTYNASPVAVEQALNTLREIKHTTRKITVLGDMLELGKFSTEEHRRIGALIPEVAGVLLTVGVRARAIAEGALAAGMSEKNIFQYDDAQKAGRELQSILQPGDIVLVKASQGIRAERIVEEIMSEPLQAEELLVRQEKDWRDIA